MSKNTVVTVVIIVILVLAGWYLLRQRSTTSPTPAPVTSTPASTKSASPSSTKSGQMSEVRQIKVSGGDFSFTPSTLSVKSGEKVRIIFQNRGKFPHNLTIDKLGVATKTISPGQTDSLELTADQTGSFVMYCSVDAHRQKGMEGTVQVQ